MDNTKLAKQICKVLLWTLIITGVYFIMLNPTFMKDGDDAQFTPFIVSGKRYMIGAWNGRFFPLGCFEYNIAHKLLPMGDFPAAWYFVNAATWVLFMLAMSAVLGIQKAATKTEVYAKTLVLFALPFLASAIISVFTSIIFPEKFMCLTLTLFMLAYKRALETDKLGWWSLALGSAVYSTYEKEPVFGALLIIIAFGFLFRRKTMTRNEKGFSLAIIINAIVFLTLWYIKSVRGWTTFYANSGDSSINFALLFGRPLFDMMWVFSAIRVWQVFVRKDRDNLYTDALLFAGTGYMMAILSMPLHPFGHYFIPTVLFAVPSIAEWASKLIAKRRWILFGLGSVLVLVVCCYEFRTIKESAVLKNSFIFGKASTLNTILKVDNYLQSGRPVLWDVNPKEQSGLYPYNVFSEFLRYINSPPYSQTKISIDIPRVERKKPVDKNAIYVTTAENLPSEDPRFADFILISNTPYPGVYVHKDRK